MNLYDRFNRFAKSLTIESKEEGLVPLHLYQGQQFVIREICRALKEDVRTLYFLKCRQMGATTVILAWDLFYHFINEGLQGTLIADTDDNREYFKSVLTNYYESLPKSQKIPKLRHNIHQFSFKNRSRLVYMVAGERDKGTLGKGKGINYLHATECASWGGGQDLNSLTSTLAEKYPHRLFLFESTAFGFNDFMDMYTHAKDTITQRAIFVTWWQSPEIYSIPKHDPRFAVYGREEPQGEERTWVREVKERHGHEITPEQMAWWRWHLYEKKRGDLSAQYQEFPPTDEYAFRMSGSQFFSAARLTDSKKLAMAYPFESYAYSFGLKFEDMQLVPSSPRYAQLKIWERPSPRGWYVVAADPAYGASDNADRFCIEVYRCYADRLVQCAEFATPDLSTTTFAWVIGHVCGYYRNAALILELQGGGDAVLQELFNMREKEYYVPEVSDQLMAVMAQISWFLYRRIDSMVGSYALHWKTTQETKFRMISFTKAAYELGQIVIKSEECLEEMKYISNEGITIVTAGKKHDDRIMATGLATIPWKDGLQMRCIQEGVKYAPEDELEKTEQEQVNAFMQGVLQSMGVVTAK